MIKILLSGCCGKMGRVIEDTIKDFPNMSIVAGIDKFPTATSYPIFNTPNEVNIDYDVTIDFSRADALEDLINLSEKTKKPLIICSTGFTSEQLNLISEKSKTLQLFKSGNMSLGINLINSLLRKITPLLYNNYNIEIIEKHHNQKLDSPSGTAVLLADTIKDVIPENYHFTHGRCGNKKRDKEEIGIHAIRGGGIIGDHDVIFAGAGEVIELSHKAISREVFAVGALKAAEFMYTVTKPGLYNMDDVLNL